MQCMTKEDCKTNKEASETDLMETVINLKTFTDASMLSPGLVLKVQIVFALLNPPSGNLF